MNNNTAVAVNHFHHHLPTFTHLVAYEGMLSEEIKQSRYVSIGKCCVTNEMDLKILRQHGQLFALTRLEL